MHCKYLQKKCNIIVAVAKMLGKFSVPLYDKLQLNSAPSAKKLQKNKIRNQNIPASGQMIDQLHSTK